MGQLAYNSAYNHGQLPFDGFQGWPKSGHRTAVRRVQRGKIAALSGNLAEDRVAAKYEADGHRIIARRWRGKAGEIDLICERGDCVIFVEVKRSRTHASAGERLQRRQMDRICLAACEFCGDRPNGLLTEMRFDAALVDELGQIEVIENAFAA